MTHRTHASAALLLSLLAAACSDATTIAPPTDLQPAPLAVLSCSGSASGVSCTPDVRSGGAQGDVIIGGQNTYVTLTGGTASFNSSTLVLSQPVTIKNLLGMPMGADANWQTLDTTAVKVFMHSPPTNGVTLTSVDGTGSFTGSNQQYIKYNEIIAGNGLNQVTKTWTFHLPSSSTTFTFQVYIYTHLPNEVGGVAANIPAHAFTSLGTSSGIPAHMCAIRSGGSVYCWGQGQAGEFGVGTIPLGAGPYQAIYPQPVQALSPLVFTAVASGEQHTCGIANGALYCWGSNTNGLLGDGSGQQQWMPVPVSTLTSGVTDVGLGSKYSCAVISGGAKCWGNNSFGELGDGTTNNGATPVSVSGLTSGVTKITAGGFVTCAIVNGGAKCWGWRSAGRIGDADTTSGLCGSFACQRTPKDVNGLVASSGVTDISAGQSFVCAVVSGGAECWGDNNAGEMGNGSTSTIASAPTTVAGLTAGSGVIQVTAGYAHACALLSGGTVKCWGANNLGQMGQGNVSPSINSPVTVVGLSGVDKIAAGNYTTCAHIAASNTIKCWGGNNDGTIGNGSTAIGGFSSANTTVSLP